MSAEEHFKKWQKENYPTDIKPTFDNGFILDNHQAVEFAESYLQSEVNKAIGEVEKESDSAFKNSMKYHNACSNTALLSFKDGAKWAMEELKKRLLQKNQ